MSQEVEVSVGVSLRKMGRHWEGEIGGQREFPLCEARRWNRTSIQCQVLQCVCRSSGGCRGSWVHHLGTGVHTALSAVPSHSGMSTIPTMSSRYLFPCGRPSGTRNPQNHCQGQSARGNILSLPGACIPLEKPPGSTSSLRMHRHLHPLVPP